MVVAALLEKTEHRLLHWRTYLGQFRHEIMHIPGKDELLSQLQRAGTETNGEVSGSLALRKVVVYACADADYTLLSKSAVKDSQLEAKR